MDAKEAYSYCNVIRSLYSSADSLAECLLSVSLIKFTSSVTRFDHLLFTLIVYNNSNNNDNDNNNNNNNNNFYLHSTLKNKTKQGHLKVLYRMHDGGESSQALK